MTSGLVEPLTNTTDGSAPLARSDFDELQAGRAVAEIVVDDDRLGHAGLIDRGARGGNRRGGDDERAVILELALHRGGAERIVVEDQDPPALQRVLALRGAPRSDGPPRRPRAARA